MNADLGDYALGELGDFDFDGLLDGDLGDYALGELGQSGSALAFKQVTILDDYADLPAASAFRDPLDNNDFILTGDTAFYDSAFDLDGFGISTTFLAPGTYIFDMYFNDGVEDSPVAEVTLVIADNIPNDFSTAVIDVPVSTLVMPEVTIAGVENGSTLYLTAGNGELSADGVIWGVTPVQVDLGVTKMRYLITSSGLPSTEVTEDVTINSITSTGSATTAAMADIIGQDVNVTVSITQGLFGSDVIGQNIDVAVSMDSGGFGTSILGDNMSVSVSITNGVILGVTFKTRRLVLF